MRRSRLDPAPIAWGLLAGLAGVSVAGLEPNLLEEGGLVHVAQRMLRGEALYRDVVFFSGPLPFAYLAGLFRIFGEDLLVARGAIVALQMIGTGFVYVTARRAHAGPLAHAAAVVFAVAPVLLFPLLSVYFYTNIVFYLTPLVVYAADRALGSPRWAVATGILLACLILCKQNVGAAMALSVAASLVLVTPAGARLSRLTMLAVGGLAVAAVTLSIFALRGTLGDFFAGTLLLPFSLTDSFRMPIPNLWPLGELDPAIARTFVWYAPSGHFMTNGSWAPGVPIVPLTQVLYALPFLALFATVARRMLGAMSALTVLHGSCLAAWMLNLFPRADWGHLVYVLPLATVQLLLVWEPRMGRSRGTVARWTGTALLGVALSLAAVRFAVTLHRQASPSWLGPRVPLRPVSAVYQSPALPRVIRYLSAHTKPGESIFVARQEPLIYFATETRNPTPFIGVVPGWRERQEKAIVAALPSVRYVVMSDIDSPVMTYYSDELPRVQEHLERFFRIPSDFPIDPAAWIFVAERGEDRGATLLDLVQALPQARAWIRAKDGTERTVKTPERLAGRFLRRPVPVPVGPRGGGLDFPVDVPEHAQFQADVGLPWTTSLSGVHFQTGGTFRLSVGGDGEFQTLAEAVVRANRSELRAWRPTEVDLGAYGGRSVTLRLEVVPAKAVQRSVAWWGSPRITARGENARETLPRAD